MGTQVERHSAEKDLAERGCGYNMPHYNIDGNDVDTVINEMGKAVDRARRGEGPSYIVANTFRFRGHSMSDPMKYRTKEEQEKAKLRDPIAPLRRPPPRAGPDHRRAVHRRRRTDWTVRVAEVEEVEQAIQQADADPHPPLEDRFDDVLAEKYPYQPK